MRARTGSEGPREVVASSANVERCTLRELILYFLRLGTFGFGGPIALAGDMQRELVERRRWISKQDYLEGLALSQLSPGPLAAQLAMYLGWVRFGTLGSAMVGLAFVLPSFLMVIALAHFYVQYGGGWMAGAFYGIGAAVIAIIARSTAKLAKMTLGSDPLLWGLAFLSALLTAITEREMMWLFLGAGVVSLVAKARRAADGRILGILPAWLITGMHGPAPASVLARIAWVFTKSGAFVFGSGLAIVPFLYDEVVGRQHWLDEKQFRDAVAVAMITPGPVVITSGFIGYLTAGIVGALIAASCTFLPPFLVVVVAARYVRKASKSPRLKAFIAGVTASAVGAIGGAAFVLGRRAIVDMPTVLIGLVALGVLFAKKIPEPIVVVLAGAVGLAVRMARG